MLSREKLVLAYSGNTAEILNTIDGYSRHKPRRKIFPRRLTFVPNIYHTLFADLIGECFPSFRLFILTKIIKSMMVMPKTVIIHIFSRLLMDFHEKPTRVHLRPSVQPKLQQL